MSRDSDRKNEKRGRGSPFTAPGTTKSKREVRQAQIENAKRNETGAAPNHRKRGSRGAIARPIYGVTLWLKEKTIPEKEAGITKKKIPCARKSQRQLGENNGDNLDNRDNLHTPKRRNLKGFFRRGGKKTPKAGEATTS